MDGFGRPRHNGKPPEETPGSRPNGLRILLTGERASMKVAILGDYHDTVRTWRVSTGLDGQDVIIWNDPSRTSIRSRPASPTGGLDKASPSLPPPATS
jgi:hypothetical protein